MENIVGYTDDGESVSVKIERVDSVVLSSQDELGTNIAVLDVLGGGRSYTENKERSKHEDQIRGRTLRHALAVAGQGKGGTGGDGEGIERQSLRDSWPRGASKFFSRRV